MTAAAAPPSRFPYVAMLSTRNAGSNRRKSNVDNNTTKDERGMSK